MRYKLWQELLHYIMCADIDEWLEFDNDKSKLI